MHQSRVLLAGLKRHDALEAFPPARILAPFLFSARSTGARGARGRRGKPLARTPSPPRRSMNPAHPQLHNRLRYPPIPLAEPDEQGGPRFGLSTTVTASGEPALTWSASTETPSSLPHFVLSSL
jgi:hypothetical protein